MSDVTMSNVTIGAVPSAIERLAPFVVPRRDRVLPILIGASLVVHATIFLPSLLHHDAQEAPRQEIPVEIVQLPPKPAPKAAAPKPVVPKPSVPKPSVPKPSVPKPPPAQPQKLAQKPPVQPRPAPKPPEPKVARKPQPKPEQSKFQQSKPQQASGEERMKQLLGPMPAIALPGASADGSEAVAYSQLVLSKVAKAKKEGRYNGIPGAAGVMFILGDAGEVVNVRVVRPSGDPTLDEEAIAMVRRGAPYPPPPPGGRRDYAITLRFQAL